MKELFKLVELFNGMRGEAATIAGNFSAVLLSLSGLGNDILMIVGCLGLTLTFIKNMHWYFKIKYPTAKAKMKFQIKNNKFENEDENENTE